MQISRIDIDLLFEMYLNSHRQTMRDFQLSSPDGYTRAISPVHQMYAKFGPGPRDLLELPGLIETRGDPEDCNGVEVCDRARLVLVCSPQELAVWAASTPEEKFFVPRSLVGSRVLTDSLIYPDVQLDGSRKFKDLHDHQVIARWLLGLSGITS